ncbi:diguanylate cyclase [Roseateles sp. NT4]|uniref:diguanylate cyclase n=1 Tax=Roseateles sp. NT4 TaxID=3453715 RepID=UPI003EEE7636
MAEPSDGAKAGAVLANRAFRWMAGTGKREVPEVWRATLLTLREPIRLTLLALFWTQAVALLVFGISGAWWAVAWMFTDFVLFVLRIVLNRRLEMAEALARRLPARRVFALHSIWIASIAIGAGMTVCQLDLRLTVLGTILPVGFCGYVVSRWQAFPRCAMMFIHFLWIGLCVGLWASPLPEVGMVAWLIPAGGVAFHMLLQANHEILLGALRAQQENRRLSMHDPLTDLPNRLMLHERLATLCRRLQESPLTEARFAVLCLDLDGFKAINDRYGHMAGDWLLRSVADRLRQAVRGNDLVCRVGGDEFVVLLPDADETAAIEIAQRLLVAVKLSHDLGGLVTVPGGASVGIAIAPRDGMASEQLLAIADDGLYAAKRAGKGIWRMGDRFCGNPTSLDEELVACASIEVGR